MDRRRQATRGERPPRRRGHRAGGLQGEEQSTSRGVVGRRRRQGVRVERREGRLCDRRQVRQVPHRPGQRRGHRHVRKPGRYRNVGRVRRWPHPSLCPRYRRGEERQLDAQQGGDMLGADGRPRVERVARSPRRRVGRADQEHGVHLTGSGRQRAGHVPRGVVHVGDERQVYKHLGRRVQRTGTAR